MVKNVVIGSPGSAFKAQFNVKNLAIGLEVIEEIENWNWKTATDTTSLDTKLARITQWLRYARDTKLACLFYL